MRKKKYVTFQIESIKDKAAKRLALFGDDMGAMALYRLIDQYVTWEEIEQEGKEMREVARGKGII